MPLVLQAEYTQDAVRAAAECVDTAVTSLRPVL